MKFAKSEKYVITNVSAPSLPNRRRRYLILMLLRVLMVPGVILLPISPLFQAALVMLAAVSQMVAVISANTPDYRIQARIEGVGDQIPALPDAARRE